MKTSYIRDWLLDLAVIIAIAVSSIFILMLTTQWGLTLARRLGGGLFLRHTILLVDILPSLLTGFLQGGIAAWLVRHRRLFVAEMSSMFILSFSAACSF